LRARLAAIDPAMLERLDASNPRRLARAIEVMEATGRSLREWQQETPEPLVREFTALWIQREKAELQARIEARVEAMFARGWVDEVRELVQQHGIEAVQAFAGIGYRQIAEGIAACGLRPSAPPAARATLELKRDICVATRRYAKRQLTWFAREPNLQKVMLTGHQSLPALLRA
jgi:tRNA dimethylallyltransferase